MTHKSISANHPSVGHHPDRLSHPAHRAARNRAPRGDRDLIKRDRVTYDGEPSDAGADGFSSVLRRIFLPPAVAAATGLAAVTVMTAVAAGSADPTALIPILPPVATALASLAGGITAGLTHRARAIPTALLCGAILSAALCLAGLAAGPDTPALWLIRLMPLPLCGMGGVWTRKRSK